MNPLNPLETIRQQYQTLLQLGTDDLMAVDFLVSVYIANITPALTEPIWAYLIAPPAGCKTELIRPFMEYERSVAISSLTENALISGYKDEHDQDPSLINLLDSKVLVIKDLTSLLTDSPSKRTKIYGDLRDAFDGTCAKSSGRAGYRSYKSRFGVIAATTGIIDAFNEENQQLGERFVACRMARYAPSFDSILASLAHVEKSMVNKEIWRTTLRETLHTQLSAIRAHLTSTTEFVVPGEVSRLLQILAYLLSQFRTTPIHGIPIDAEAASRILQQLKNLGLAHMLSECRTAWNDSDTILVKRVIIDTLSITRRRFLLALYGWNNALPSLSINQITTLTHTSSSAATDILNQYLHSGLIDELTVQGEKHYQFTTIIRGLLNETTLLCTGPHLPQLSRKDIHYAVKT